jgi:DeoR family ulaG and ulaABCDEF operon transcriptional repressor
MHASERETLILRHLEEHGFVSFRDLENLISGSPATIRRDLERLNQLGKIERVRGGAKIAGSPAARGSSPSALNASLMGSPFHENVGKQRKQKSLIGRAAAELCQFGEGIMIDGGSTTLQMCSHLEGKNLQVLTNSLHIVGKLLDQEGTNILIAGGNVFREQNIILTAAGDDCMPRFHAPKLFMGAAAVGSQGIMQQDIVLVASERRLIDRADEIVVLVDSSKFNGPSGNVVCSLSEIDVIVTDEGITTDQRKMVEDAGVRLIIARP